MKRLLVLMMAVMMTLSLAACGGSNADPSASSSTPTQAKEAEFTAEQQALAKEFADMVERFNETIDRVNATPELLDDEEISTTLNELADVITAADENFASPEMLTPEVMDNLKAAVEEVHKFIDVTETALDEIERVKAAIEKD
ncbi:MAG: hypothetical protein ACOX7R_12560 [Acetivibrionales bacterium]